MLNRPLPALPGDVVLLVGRVILGGVLFAHGWHKVMIDGIAGTSGEFERLGIPLAILSASFAAFVEFVGGVLLIVGALTTTVVALDLVVMVGAAVFVHLTQGIVAENDGLELVGVIIAAELVLVAKGPGRFSVDEWVMRLRHGFEQGLSVGAATGAGVAVVAAPVAVLPLPDAEADRFAFAGRLVGAVPIREPGWVSGSWADGFDGEPPTSPEGRPVTEAPRSVLPTGPQPDTRPGTGSQWGVWRLAGDGVVAADRRGDAPGGGWQTADTATGVGPRTETSVPGKGDVPAAPPARNGNAAGPVDGVGVGRSRQATVPSIPLTRVGDGGERSLVVEGAGVGVAAGDRGLAIVPAESRPTSGAAGIGASFRTPADGPAPAVPPRRPAPDQVDGAVGSGRAKQTAPAPRTERVVPTPSPRPHGVVPTPAPRVGGQSPPVPDRVTVPAPVTPAAPDAARQTAGAASPRPAATTTGLHRRPAEPARRSTAATPPVAADIFRPVTEGVPPPAASYPHPGYSPDPVSRSVRAYAPQLSAPASPPVVSARTARPEPTDVGPAASGPTAATQAERTGTSSGRGPAAGSGTAAVPVEVRDGGSAGPLAVAQTAAIPVTRPATVQGLHQSAEYQPTPTEALPKASPSERSVAARPAPRPSPAGPSS